MSEALVLQALESTADQIDHLAEIIDEFLTMAEAGVPMRDHAPELRGGDGRRSLTRRDRERRRERTDDRMHASCVSAFSAPS